jgi:hypothetical protein
MKTSRAVLIWLALGSLPAWADSRDLVIDRMSRCYSLPETRQYLECLYGAVQPLRNELGLPPAPQAASFASTFSRPALVPPPVPARPQASSAPGLVSKMMGIETRRVAAEQFGLPNARPGTGLNVDRITARMADYSIDRSGLFTVTLDNGQVWRQRSGDRPNWRKAASSYAVTVSYGAFGSFNFSVAGETQPYKVERIR